MIDLIVPSFNNWPSISSVFDDIVEILSTLDKLLNIPSLALKKVFNWLLSSLVFKSDSLNSIFKLFKKSIYVPNLERSKFTFWSFDVALYNFLASSYLKYVSAFFTAATIAFVNSRLDCLDALAKLPSPITTSPVGRMNTEITSGFCFLNVFQKADTNCRSCFFIPFKLIL